MINMKFTNLNIIEINYSQSYFCKVPKTSNVFINLINKICSTVSYCIKGIIKDFLFFPRNENLKNKNICFYSSVNQYNALKPLNYKLQNSVFVGLERNSENRLYMGIGFMLSFILLPYFIYVLNKKYKKHKLRIIEYLPHYFNIYGMFMWWRFYLKRIKPKSIIFPNDHLVWHRVLRIAAESSNIPTIYIQHASVTERFPKLEFDLSLLEGQDALDKYSKKGINGKVILVGMLKFDKYYSKINQSKSAKTIGICTNILDDESLIEKLCSELKFAFPEKTIILRPHPRDARFSFYKNLIVKFKIEFSDSKIENSFEFLQKVDVNIAGESSIHLETVLLNVYPIYFQFSKNKLDHYGYIKNNLIMDYFDKTKPLIDKINNIKNNKPNVRNRAKYYIDTIGSKHDGKSVEKALKIVKNLVENINH